MDPSKYSAQSNSSGIPQQAPPQYQDPNAGYPAPGSYPMSSGYPSQPYGVPGGQPVVTVQPMYVTATPLANPLPDYLGFSIFTMLCCCLPLGIAALVFSISTRNANTSGQQQLAEKDSKTARSLNYAALGIGLAFLVAYIVIIVVNVVKVTNGSP
ncbi:dispanin subfamily A member 2b-like [Xyrauchen texanus]|uniref:dispanin subfamily A member 2b-like n=1 Tax=Xyrauchen texanus TaxID=154827 RepID=UPI002241A19B|nr:dispanin subfamily A member 2b-like [Xyrauchen texanus]